MLAACSTDTREEKPAGPDSPGGSSQEIPRQEVQVTFTNRLSVGAVPQPAAGSEDANVPATAEGTSTQPVENRVTSLDVYVFGSPTEDGVYTFQERFAYREDPAAVPAGATELKLESAEGDDSQTTALLSLQKGLFVKLYCIANQPDLVDPADETKPVGDAGFKPLELAEPGKAASAVKTAGTPELTAFETFHTPLLDPAAEKDTLVCPLPMSGSAGKAIDLTDYTATARVQTDIRLTRLVARFDISNHSELSRFTIESVSLNNGRKGAGFFPVKVYGTLPDAAAGDLITYPERQFHGARANLGIRMSAFYCYPSLLSDGSQLVLKGKYRKSETESVDVSYPVRFASSSDATGTPLAVHPDRRYAVVITGADAEHLDFVLQELDWSDSGALDDYDPQVNPEELGITIPEDFQADTEWDASTSTVSMTLKDGNHFAVSVTGSDAALVVAKTYAGDNPDYDWLEISEPAISPQTKALPAFGYTYTFSLKENYTAGRYPRATVRFIDNASGRENKLFVEPNAVPRAVALPPVPGDTNPNGFDAETLTAAMYRFTGSSLKIKLLCPDGVEMESAPAWLTVTPEENAAETLLTLVLNDREVADATGTLVFHNKKQPDLKTDITVNLQDADVAASFDALGGTGTVYTPATDAALADVKIPVTGRNSFAVQTTSLQGITVAIDFDGGPEWLSHDGETYTAAANEAPLNAPVSVPHATRQAGNQTATLTFSLVPDKLAGGKKATVTLKNTIGGADYSFTVTPAFQGVTVTREGVSVPIDDKLENTTLTLYKLPSTSSTMDIRVTSYGGSKLQYEGTGLTLSATESTDNEAVYTLTATGAGQGTLKVMNYTDHTQFTEYTVNILPSELEIQDTNIDLDAAGNATGTNRITACPLGYEAEITWADGGAEWFEITSANPSTTSGEQDIALQVKSGLSNAAVIDTACITLTNTIAGGGNVSFRVTPVWQASTLGSTSRSVGVNETVSVSAQAYGGITAISNDTSIATVEVVTGSEENIGKEYIRITGVAEGSTAITVKNKQDESKTTTYTVTVGAYVTINGLKWAVGNLVTDGEHGCKVGAPTDGGLYFRFGSLVGYDDSEPTGNPTAVVTPTEYTGGKPVFTESPYQKNGEITENAAAGTGDPCKYYLGGSWRLPTEAEYRQSLGGGVSGSDLFNNRQWIASYENSGVAGAIFNNTAEGPKIFFPASGHRDCSNGTLAVSGSNGYGWTSVPNSGSAWYVYFYPKGAYMNSYNSTYGFPVRCVQE